jgi:predicted dehydrogenase
VSRSPLRVAVIGCGLIGRKRAEALGDDRLVGCYDIDVAAAQRLAGQHGATACASLDELLGLHADVVVVATVHDQLSPLARRALDAGHHVLVEKPAGVSLGDVELLRETAQRTGRLVKVGFNHRFHPGIERAITEARSGLHGAVMFARGRYGHGGRIGYEREWRADPAISGGGEIIDQGMHLLDLSHWLLGPLPLQHGLLRTHFWNAPVDDNAVLLLGERGRGVGDASPWALFHVSWTEWKNMFSLEIYCERAKFAVNGLTRSYGPQELFVYSMRPELGPPDVEHVQYPDRDVSWEREWQHFAGAVRSGSGAPLLGDLESAAYAWHCVEQAQR